jgi:hypothetical protein
MAGYGVALGDGVKAFGVYRTKTLDTASNYIPLPSRTRLAEWAAAGKGGPPATRHL